MNGKRAEINNGSHIFSATSSFILLLRHGIKALKVLGLSVLSFLCFLLSPTTFFSFLPLSASSVCRLIHFWHFRQVLFFFRLVHSFSLLFGLARYTFFLLFSCCISAFAACLLLQWLLDLRLCIPWPLWGLPWQLLISLARIIYFALA